MQFIKTLALAAACALVTACGGGDTEDRLDVRDPVVRFIHAVPGAPNVTFQRDNVPQADATNVAYKSVSRYYDVSNANATWSVVSAASPSTTLASGVLNPSQGDRFTFIALPDTAAGAVRLTAIVDPYDKGLTTDKARVRAFHAAPATGPVDVYLVQPAQDLATATPLFANVGYGTSNPASAQDSLEIPGGTYRLVITPAGSKTVVFNASSVSIANNADWLLLAIPGPSGAATDVRVLVAQGNDESNGTSLELVSQP